jgi:CheY-specific phosphatase CheX
MIASQPHSLKPELLLPLIAQSFTAVIDQHSFSDFVTVDAIEPTRDVCAMISLTGPVSIMFVLTLDHAVAWRVMQHEVKVLGLEESEDMLEAVLGEITNVIGGNATAYLVSADQQIHLSLPLIFRAAKARAGVGKVTIYRSRLLCTSGQLDAYFVTPAQLSFVAADETK